MATLKCVEENRGEDAGPAVVPEESDVFTDDVEARSGGDDSSRFIQTRAKERKHYTDEDIDDDEIEGKRNYNIEDKLLRSTYKGNYVQYMKGPEFTLKFVQENGLLQPILFKDKTGLGMRVPSENFKVSDVKQCVGSRRMLDVMDVNTQKGLEMTMKDWVRYYENIKRDRLLNVISLEFSHTRLENYVESPTLVRQVDWVDRVWPRHLKDCQTESTNIIEKMKYPKVQKYCLMSVAGCYTDFHIDFGGTSVWYHILHGEKIFWLIPPTEANVELYENWVLSAKQGDIFLPDQVSECQKIHLQAGDTFIIPSGWIHAVYTPRDSLVFGGNFLHSFNILQQLRVADVEDKTHVPQKFRYPFYNEIMWYVLTRYVECVGKKSYLKKPDKVDLDEQPESPGSFFTSDDSRPPSRNPDSRPPSRNPEEHSPVDFSKLKLEKDEEQKLSKSVTIPLTRIDDSGIKKSQSDDESLRNSRSVRKLSTDSVHSENGFAENGDMDKRSGDSGRRWVHLTKFELEGLAKLVEKVENLPLNKRRVPKDLLDPDAVLRDIKQLLADHKYDNTKAAASGEPTCWVPETTKKVKKLKTTTTYVGGKTTKGCTASKVASGNRRRRTRCKKCEACTRSDCGECNFCKDMRKFGGPGRMKQSCISRKCMAPVLPHTVTCCICEKDGKMASEDNPDEIETIVMECSLCWEIVHPACLKEKYDSLDNDGIVNEDLPNSWECAKCCNEGKQGQLKPKTPKPVGRPKGIDSRRSSASSVGDLEVKEEVEMEATLENNNTKMAPVKAVEGKRVTSKETPAAPKPSPSSTPIPTPRKLIKRETLVKKAIQHRVSQQRALKRDRLKHVRRLQSADTVKRVLPQVRATIIPKSPPHVMSRSGKRALTDSSDDDDDDDDEDGPSRKRPRREGRTRARNIIAASCTKLRPRFFKTAGQGQDRVVAQLRTSPAKRGCHGGGQGSSGHQNKSPKGKGSNRDRSNERSNPPSDRGEGQNPDQPAGFSGSRPRRGDGAGPVCDKELRVVINRYVVRPAPIPPPADTVELETGDVHVLKRQMWMTVFKKLDLGDLARCLCVCKTWNRWCINRCLWKEINLRQTRIRQCHLVGIVRRQPESLTLAQCVMTPKQLSWLVVRLPQLHHLDLSYLSWGTIGGLCSSSCPLLRSLSLNWAVGLSEDSFRDLVLPPADRKPALKVISRLHKVHTLSLAGTEVTDQSIEILLQHMPNVERLNLSYCVQLTNATVVALTKRDSPLMKKLKQIDLSGCLQITDHVFHFLKACSQLETVKFHGCPKVTRHACQKFVDSYICHQLSVQVDKMIITTPDTSDG
ncbi:lysine-specific demethylase 2A-like isoform X2 [Haliotis rubra]|uniref:lysine-specific demethylase 2A-like isoform X2 n=1 Tax=Haliotis rubra TaxID=36100 RepID=UPI001EE50481|nr:lysine-specific demethylase 2A-like isoform X2 [Haliotis rubra]